MSVSSLEVQYLDTALISGRVAAAINSRLPPLAPAVEEEEKEEEEAEEGQDAAAAYGATPPPLPPPHWPPGVAAGEGDRSQQLLTAFASRFLETLLPAGGAKTNWPLTTGWRHRWPAAADLS